MSSAHDRVRRQRLVCRAEPTGTLRRVGEVTLNAAARSDSAAKESRSATTSRLTTSGNPSVRFVSLHARPRTGDHQNTAVATRPADRTRTSERTTYPSRRTDHRRARGRRSVCQTVIVRLIDADGRAGADRIGAVLDHRPEAAVRHLLRSHRRSSGNRRQEGAKSSRAEQLCAPRPHCPYSASSRARTGARALRPSRRGDARRREAR